MNEFFKNLGERKFLLYSILSALIGDILISIYIHNKFSDFEKFKVLFGEMLLQAGGSLNDFPPEMISEQFFIIIQTLTMMIAFYIFIQLAHYLLYYLGKSYGKKYFCISNYLALIFAPFLIVAEAIPFSFWSIVFMGQTALYFFIFKGYAHFFKVKEQLKVSPSAESKSEVL